MSVTYTGERDVVTALQYVEESTEDSFPANATLLWIGLETRFALTSGAGPAQFWALGSDNAANPVPHGQQISGMRISYFPQDLNFLKKAFNVGTAAGTRGPTFSLYGKITLGGTTNYLTMTGCRIGTASIVCRANGLVTADVQVIGRLATYNTSPPTGATEASDPATTGYHASMTGANMTIGSDTPKWAFIMAGVNNNAFPVWIGGQATMGALKLGPHQAGGRIAIQQTGTTYDGYFRNSTLKDIVWTITTGETVTWDDAYLENQVIEYAVGGGDIAEIYDIIAKNVTLA